MIIQPGMPESVRRALILLFVTLAMDVGRILLDASYIESRLSRVVPAWVVVGLVSVVALLFIGGVANGRRWVVVFMAVLGALSLPGEFQQLAADLSNNSRAWFIWQTLNDVLFITALVLLFGRPARAWFRDCKLARS